MSADRRTDHGINGSSTVINLNRAAVCAHIERILKLDRMGRSRGAEKQALSVKPGICIGPCDRCAGTTQIHDAIRIVGRPTARTGKIDAGNRGGRSKVARKVTHPQSHDTAVEYQRAGATCNPDPAW